MFLVVFKSYVDTIQILTEVQHTIWQFSTTKRERHHFRVKEMLEYAGLGTNHLANWAINWEWAMARIFFRSSSK